MYLRDRFTPSRETAVLRGRLGSYGRDMRRGKVSFEAYTEAKRQHDASRAIDVVQYALGQMPVLEPAERTRLVTLIAKHLDLTAVSR